MDPRVKRLREAEAKHAKRDEAGAPLVLLDRAVRDCIDCRITQEDLDIACLDYLGERGILALLREEI